MSQADLWNNAAECARAIEATDDPIKRELLTRLQALWICLANESPFLGEDTLAKEAAQISSIHAL